LARRPSGIPDLGAVSGQPAPATGEHPGVPSERRKSPPREGPALLQGLLVCGRSGETMSVRYQTRGGRQVPVYGCGRFKTEQGEVGKCQEISGAALDRATGELLVEAVSPMALEVVLAVQQELTQRSEEADRLRRQQVERARYDADLAHRRYLRVDPDNRLV